MSEGTRARLFLGETEIETMHWCEESAPLGESWETYLPKLSDFAAPIRITVHTTRAMRQHLYRLFAIPGQRRAARRAHKRKMKRHA